MSSLANSHEAVTILFTDIVGFTSMSKEVAPHQVGEGRVKLMRPATTYSM
jgi:class 3 adenylate cyclase